MRMAAWIAAAAQTGQTGEVRRWAIAAGELPTGDGTIFKGSPASTAGAHAACCQVFSPSCTGTNTPGAGVPNTWPGGHDISVQGTHAFRRIADTGGRSFTVILRYLRGRAPGLHPDADAGVNDSGSFDTNENASVITKYSRGPENHRGLAGAPGVDCELRNNRLPPRLSRFALARGSAAGCLNQPVV